MANPAPAAARSDSMADWLALHGISAPQMRKLLTPARPVPPVPPVLAPPPPPEPPPPTNLAGETAWQMAGQAALWRWPALRPEIDTTLKLTQRHFALDAARYKRAFTFQPDPADPGRILVGMAYQADLRGLLTMAHEFGHALQLTTSQGCFMPPILREACAGLAEAALIAALPDLGPDLAPDLAENLRALWQKDRTRIGTQGAEQVIAALNAPRSRYRYRWNYPPAHALLGRPCPDPKAVFSGQLSLMDWWQA